MKKLYLVDVSSMFFRAFYAIRPLSTPAGVPVNAVYGFLSMITKLIKEEKPERMVFCYDRKDPSFRKEMYQEYKANRSEMPDDLAVQIPYIKKLADLLGVPSLEVPQFEADDLIGTLTVLGRQQNHEVIIVSGDKDFAQLITPHVFLYDTMKEVRYDAEKAFEKWGVRPDQFIDFLAIVGDTSDNIPGVKGIGEKGAIKLLQQFKDLEDIYAHIDQVESKSIKQKLLDSHEMALLSKKLVTIVTTVPVSENMEDYRLRPLQSEGLRALLQELNFKSFERSLLGEVGSTSVSQDSAMHALTGGSLVESPSANASAVNANTPGLEQTNSVTTFSTEPKNNSVLKSTSPEAFLFEEKTLELNEIADWISTQAELYVYFDARGIYLYQQKQLVSYAGEATALGQLLQQKSVVYSGYNLKALWHHLQVQDPQVKWDSQLAAYVVKTADCSDFAKIYQRESGEILAELSSPAQVMAAHLHLQQILQQKLQELQAQSVYQDLDLPLAKILLQMENKGIRVDTDLLAQQSQDLQKDIATLEKQIHELAGEVFNVASPKQLGVILFEKLGLATGKKTKTGYSTDNDVLEGLEHPIARLVLQFRELSKLKSTYVDAIPLLADKSQRVHTHFNQALTSTGRLSSTQPNLQNIPIRTERGQLVRKAFIAAPGKKLMSVDYSQIELRILAHISEDPNMCKAFAEDLDIHSATAAEIFNVSLAEVTSDLRRTAKAVNFGIAYGQGAFGLAETLGIGRSEAQDIIKRYFERFKNVRDYIDSTIKKAHENFYVETLFGRRRYIDELQSKNNMLKKFGERAAINAPIQGTASDLVKKAMIEIFDKVSVPMLLQVHDELIFEESEEVLQQNKAELIRIMENVTKLRVPLKVNYAIGNNWDEAH